MERDRPLPARTRRRGHRRAGRAGRCARRAQRLAALLHRHRPPALAHSSRCSVPQSPSAIRCSPRWRTSRMRSSPSARSQCAQRAGSPSVSTGPGAGCHRAPWITHGTTCSRRQNAAARSPAGSAARKPSSRATSSPHQLHRVSSSIASHGSGAEPGRGLSPGRRVASECEHPWAAAPLSAPAGACTSGGPQRPSATHVATASRPAPCKQACSRVRRLLAARPDHPPSAGGHTFEHMFPRAWSERTWMRHLLPRRSSLPEPAWRTHPHRRPLARATTPRRPGSVPRPPQPCVSPLLRDATAARAPQSAWPPC